MLLTIKKTTVKRNFYLLIVIGGLWGCESENNDLSNLTEIKISAEQTYVEGEIAHIAIAGNEEDQDLQFEVDGLTSLYVEKVTHDRYLAVMPMVSKDTNVTLRLKNNQQDQDSEHQRVSFTILNTELKKQLIAPAPNVFSSSGIAKHDSKKKDSSGVPLLEVSGTDYYYPVHIAQYAYDLYNNYYHTHDADILDKFITNANWLKQNCIYTKYGFCSYRAEFPLESYNVFSDWTTAMGQGQAISSLIAAHYLTGDSDYAETALAALSAFAYPISEKGLRADFEGVWWYEEYGSEDSPAHVLNGFIFALSGIKDFVDIYDLELAKNIFAIGISSLKARIHLYDFSFTSKYDHSHLNQLASAKGGPDIYHELHIFQLGWLYNVTGEDIIKKYTEKFLMQDMGGLKSIGGPFYRASREFAKIKASYSTDPENYGESYLYDANWTWNRYWSSHRFPVDLELTLNSDILEEGKLLNFSFTSVSIKDLPNTISLYEIDENGLEYLIKENIAVDKNSVYEHETGGYKSATVVQALDVPVKYHKIKLRIHGTDSGSVKLRELDIHYPRPTLLEKIINYYSYP